jgi:hypothetical protein
MPITKEVSKARIAYFKRIQPATNDFLYLGNTKATLELFLNPFRACERKRPAGRHESDQT